MLGIICLTCKKKTSIQVHVFNPALDEYVPNATVVLVEKTGDGGGGLFGGPMPNVKKLQLQPVMLTVIAILKRKS